MVTNKGKRKIVYEGRIFYWFVRINEDRKLRIYIVSEDKKINLEHPPFDSEIPITPAYIRKLLDEYFFRMMKKNEFRGGK